MGGIFAGAWGQNHPGIWEGGGECPGAPPSMRSERRGFRARTLAISQFRDFHVHLFLQFPKRSKNPFPPLRTSRYRSCKSSGCRHRFGHFKERLASGTETAQFGRIPINTLYLKGIKGYPGWTNLCRTGGSGFTGGPLKVPISGTEKWGVTSESPWNCRVRSVDLEVCWKR